MEKRVTSNMVHRREGPPVNGHGNGLRSFAISFSLKKQSLVPSRLSPVKSLSINDITPQSVFGGQSPSDSDGEDKTTAKREEEEIFIGSACEASTELECLKNCSSSESLLPAQPRCSSTGSRSLTPVESESHVLSVEVLPANLNIKLPSPHPVGVAEEKDGQVKGEMSLKSAEEALSAPKSQSNKRKRSRSRSGVDVRKKRRSVSRDRHHHSRRRKDHLSRRRSVDLRQIEPRRDRDLERRNGPVNGSHPVLKNDQGRQHYDANQRDKELLPRPDSEFYRTCHGRRDSQPTTTTIQPNRRHQPVLPAESDVKFPRELTRLSITRPRLFISAARAHAADFIELWDSTSTRSGGKELKRSFDMPACNDDIPLPTGDSRESSVGVIVDEATNISEPIDMQLIEEVKEEPQPGPLDIGHHPKVSFSLATGMRRGSNTPLQLVEVESAALQEKSLPWLDLPASQMVAKEEEKQDTKIAKLDLPIAKDHSLREPISKCTVSTSKNFISFPVKKEPEVGKPVVKVSFSMPKKVNPAPEKMNGIPDRDGVKKVWMEEEDEKLHRKLSLASSAPMLATYASFLHDLKLSRVEHNQEPREELNEEALLNKEVDLDTSSGASDIVIDHAEVDSDLIVKLEVTEMIHGDVSPQPAHFEPEQGEEREISRPVEAGVTFSRPASRISGRNSPRRASTRRSRSRSRSLRRSDNGSAGGARLHRRSRSPTGRTHGRTERRSPSPDRRRRLRPHSPSPSPGSRPFHSKITMNIQRELQSLQPQHSDNIKDRNSGEKEGRPLKQSHSPDYQNSVKHYLPKPTDRRSRSPSLRSHQRSRSPRRSTGREGRHHRSHFRPHSRDREEGRRVERPVEKDDERCYGPRILPAKNSRWTSKSASDSGATSPAGQEYAPNVSAVDDTSPTGGSPPTRNSLAERYATIKQQAYLKESHADSIRVAALSRSFVANIRNANAMKPNWPTTELSKVPIEPEFPPVTEPAVGTFPVPFTFPGTGPVFCWPYYMPDGTIVLVPYLGLEKAPDANSIQQLVAVSHLVEPPPLLISGCPLGYTPFNLSAIPTYDPTRAIPPPPPCATAPLNQPTKPSVLKLIRIQQKERERIKRQRAEKEKLQPVFDTPTPTSESLSSKTTTPLPGETSKIAGENLAVLERLMQQVI